MLVAHDPVPAELLAQLLEEPTVMVEQWCEELAEAYVASGHGFELIHIAGGWRYQTASDLTPYVERFLLHDQRARLSGAALETLAIIAYKQPISRGQIASIRGVDPDGVIRTLQARGYIDEIGRDDGPGQAILFGTTGTFLEKLGLASLDDLPPIAEFIPSAEVIEALETGLRITPIIEVSTSTGGSARSDQRAVTDRTPEPPLWEQMAAASAALPQGERLQKVLAATGYGSRRVCEDLIAAGRVTVNGDRGGSRPSRGPRRRSGRGRRCADRRAPRPRVLPPQQAHRRDHDGRDTHGRQTVLDLVPSDPRVFSVGRLDVDTEGLLLLTNDGQLANRIAHPSHGIEKEYLVEVRGGPASAGALRSLREGVELDDGMTAPARVSQPDPGVLRLVIHEGRNRQVRRMCEAVGYPVTPTRAHPHRPARRSIVAAGPAARPHHRRMASPDRGGRRCVRQYDRNP